MFKYLKGFDKIICTGAQRSGTTICAKMIAHDLGYQYVDEEELKDGEEYSIDKLKELCNIGSGFVAQCPSLCRYIHELGDRKDTAIIFMKRNLEEIIESQKRILWEIEEKRELCKYGLECKEGIESKPIAEVKWSFWNEHQKYKILNHFEIEYYSLVYHPMWVQSWKRKNFKSKQTEV